MIDSLYIGASGMHAQQLSIDVIANNMANVNTAGFKKNRVDFEDLLYRSVVRANGLLGSPDNTHRMGMGTAIAATEKIFIAGDLKKTDGPLDLAIQGQGFFEVLLPDGTNAYTRSGAFTVDREGMLGTSDGHALTAQIQIPSDATDVLIEPNGEVLVLVPDDNDPINIGEIEIVNFLNPGRLNAVGDSLYVPTPESGDAVISIPGENGSGTIAQGFLEASNVKLIEEMINLIIAQRAYEVNSKVIQASDELLRISNSLMR